MYGYMGPLPPSSHYLNQSSSGVFLKVSLDDPLYSSKVEKVGSDGCSDVGYGQLVYAYR